MKFSSVSRNRFCRMGTHVTFLLTLSGLSLVTARISADTVPLYKNPKAPLQARVNDLFKRLTENEKLSLMTGTGFTTVAIPRLGIPPMSMADGAQGVRGGDGGTQGPATAFPAGVCLASTWNTALIKQVGQAIGDEALNKGTGAEVLLAPAINIQRSPLDGRNGEFFTEDPYLNAELAIGYIDGVQSTGCAACVKHYVCNNEEIDRGYVNVKVGERALREIYLPGFRAAIKKAHAWSIMAAYNKVNGQFCTDNWYLLHDVLNTDWGFKGLSMSDWGAVHDTVGPVLAGLDLEMPGPGFLRRRNLEAALKSGQITQDEINRAVKRTLRCIIQVGLLNGPRTLHPSQVNSPAHQALDYKAATEGIVLLKNEGNVLPFNAHKLKSIAIIGPRAKDWQLGAYGSVGVNPFFSINPYDGIVARARGNIQINYSQGTPNGDDDVPVPSSDLYSGATDSSTHGLTGAYYAGSHFVGQPVVTRVDDQLEFGGQPADMPATMPGGQNISVRWTGMLMAPITGRYLFTIRGNDGYRLYIGNKRVINRWMPTGGNAETGGIRLQAGQTYPIKLEYYKDGGAPDIHLNWVTPGTSADFADAVNAAKSSDVAIVFVGSSDEAEGVDRPSMDLQGRQGALVRAVAAANKNTIVVLNNGTPVRMTDWIHKVKGVIEGWFPGEEGGKAIASILFGDVNPSGRLPVTLAAYRKDYPDEGNYPGKDGEVHYAEGIYVGYRYFDKMHIKPLFPFGYGLSYTTFKFSHIHLSSNRLSPRGAITVKADITNTGHRAGAEVVQMYLHDPDPKISRAVRELKGFDRVNLNPGQTKAVSFTVNPRDLAYCDVAGKEWRAYPGVYDVELGASSRDIRLSAPFRLTSVYTRHINGMGMKDPYLPKPSLSTNRPVKASSVIHGNKPQYAIDDDPSTRWESDWSDPQWITVDLGKPTLVDAVILSWEAAYAQSFQIQVSNNNAFWRTVYSTNSGSGGLEQIHFKPVKARYVRMYGIKRATQFGYSLYSFDVYGPAKK